MNIDDYDRSFYSIADLLREGLPSHCFISNNNTEATEAIKANEEPSCVIPSCSISDIASAIEIGGFYTWDRFERFIYVKPDGECHRELFDNVLNSLAKTVLGHGELNADFMFSESSELNLLENCGWPDSNLPDFKGLRHKWNAKYLGDTSSILKKNVKEDPATQSKIWDVLEGLVKLHFEKKYPGIVEDLKSSHSDHASDVCGELQTVGLSIEPKTLKKYFTKKG